MEDQDTVWAPAIDTIRQGGVAIIPTDTLYGIVGSALDPEAVERIYTIKKRDTRKPLIVLISSTDDLETFGVVVSNQVTTALGHLWPGPVSVILPTIDDSFSYLHRGTDEIAFRIPADEVLIELLNETGPLVAPSANEEGEAPVDSIEEARRIFRERVDAIVDAPTNLEGEPSMLVRMDDDGEIVIIRGGGIEIPDSNIGDMYPEDD